MDWLLTPWISIGGAALLAVIVVMAVTARRPPKDPRHTNHDADPASVWMHGAPGHSPKSGRDAPGKDDGDHDGDADGDD